MEYEIGQIFIEEYPIDAVEWCANNKAYIGEIEPLQDARRFEIFEDNTPPEPINIDALTMTALDFVNFLKDAGLTDLDIETYLSANLDVKHQLEFCKDVYCGVAKALMPIEYAGVTITKKMVEKAFKDKHGVK